MQTKVIEIDPKKIKGLAVNAHYMVHETFQRLVANIKKDGELTQLPFAAPLGYYYETDTMPLDDDGQIIYEVLSGNHRVKAAIEAGLKIIKIQVTDSPLEPDKRKAIQLSHNALIGQDDPTLLAEIYQSIVSFDERIYTGLDDKQLDLLKDDPTKILAEANLTFQSLTMLFLPDEISEVNAIWEKAKAAMKGAKCVWLDRWANYDQALDAMETVGLTYGVQNTATIFSILLHMLHKHITELQEGCFDMDGVPKKEAKGVPIEVVTGGRVLPPKTAAKLKKALDKAQSEGKIKDGKWWLLLDKWLEAG